MSKQTELAQVADTITVNSGNVGIGTSSPAADLHVNSGASNLAGLFESTDAGATISLIDNGTTGGSAAEHGLNTVGDQLEIRAVDNLSFETGGAGSEAMRIDASGNLLVGGITTLPSSSVNGFGVLPTGIVVAAVSNDKVTVFNRNGSDGDVSLFQKNGSTIGRIGVYSSSAFIYGSSGLRFTANSIVPVNSNGSNSDNDQDLGSAGVRFDDIYATNGTIQTSDRNEKQDIAELSDAEQRVAVAAKGLLRKFRWRDAVEAKGDEARTHFGIIAQDLQAAFAAEGLDAGDYAMFISSTWWEHDVEVPAVEAVAEVLDEDGNVVTEAVEAADAYTRTDTYDTQEEAPEGATERTRLGVRYSELLAFIIGAL